MAVIRVKLEDTPELLVKRIRGNLRKRSVASVIVDNAKTRIRKGGDSEIKYPELWAVQHGVGYRKNGKPLRDTGMLMNMLSVKTESLGDGVRWTLLDGTGYGVKHQEGFINRGPIAIALSPKARMPIKGLGDPPHDLAYLDSIGLEEAPNFESAQNPREGNLKYDYYVIDDGAKVPARPIANMPPEDVKKITKHIKKMIRGLE